MRTVGDVKDQLVTPRGSMREMSVDVMMLLNDYLCSLDRQTPLDQVIDEIVTAGVTECKARRAMERDIMRRLMEVRE